MWMAKMDLSQVQLTQEDVTKLLVEWLRSPNHGAYSSYGYEVYLPALAYSYVKNKYGNNLFETDIQNWFIKNSPLFYAAAWDLCRRGILRPGVTSFQQQATTDGASGNGYSITPYGRQWLEEAEHSDFVPTEPERFAQMLAPYKEKFGKRFHQRAQEAVRCYGAHAYLACCAMCGAAAESILLATAIEKSHDEKKVLILYSSRSGRQQVENLILGKSDKKLQEEFKGYNALLKYWRDESAHGQTSKIIENEAYTAIAMLLRFALFTDRVWDDLVEKN
jgi:hypothetical protein